MKGEAYRQDNKKEKTEEIWKKLTQDKDDLFRTKAGLALTILLVNDNKIDNKQAIDRLERLRYAWRGDALEANVNYWLGISYFKEKKFIKGLSIMRDAAGYCLVTRHLGNVLQRIWVRHLRICSLIIISGMSLPWIARYTL